MDRHVALAADAAYVRHAGAAAASVGRRAPGTTVHLLHTPDVPEVDRVRFERAAVGAGSTPVLHEIGAERLADLPTMQRIGSVMWFRLLLPDLLPEVDRVVYLDADTYVVDDLEPLFAHPLDDGVVGAVDNVLEPAERPRVARLGIPATQGYFNSGVLLMDLAAWRAGRVADRVLDLARDRRSDLQWPDQDALNLQLGPDRVRLHPRWNAQNSLFHWRSWADEVFGDTDVTEAVEHPAVVHFEGPGRAKPWHRDFVHPWCDAYRQLAAETPWGPLDLVAPASPGLRTRLRRRWRRLRAR